MKARSQFLALHMLRALRRNTEKAVTFRVLLRLFKSGCYPSLSNRCDHPHASRPHQLADDSEDEDDC
jgi:hypothetical protein